MRKLIILAVLASVLVGCASTPALTELEPSKKDIADMIVRYMHEDWEDDGWIPPTYMREEREAKRFIDTDVFSREALEAVALGELREFYKLYCRGWNGWNDERGWHSTIAESLAGDERVRHYMLIWIKEGTFASFMADLRFDKPKIEPEPAAELETESETEPESGGLFGDVDAWTAAAEWADSMAAMKLMRARAKAIALAEVFAERCDDVLAWMMGTAKPGWWGNAEPESDSIRLYD